MFKPDILVFVILIFVKIYKNKVFINKKTV